MLYQGQPRRRLEVRAGFLLQRMRRVVGGDDVDQVIANPP